MTYLRRRVILFASFLLLLIGYFGLIQPPGRPRKLDRFLIRRRANATVGSRTVVVYDRNKFHDEVHGAVLWTLSQFDDVRVVFYRREWRFQFEQVISSFWPTEMEPRDPGLFILDMWADHSVRDVILTTCDWDLQYIVEDLEKIWGAREDEEKFNVICLRHWPGDGPIKDLEFFVRQGAMSQLGLGDHVGQSIEKSKEQAIKHFSRTEGNEETIEAIPNIRTRTFVPMFPPDLPERDEPARTAMTKGELSLALIQSSFWNEQHRAIKATFDTLEAALHGGTSVRGIRSEVELMRFSRSFDLGLRTSCYRRGQLHPAPTIPRLQSTIPTHRFGFWWTGYTPFSDTRRQASKEQTISGILLDHECGRPRAASLRVRGVRPESSELDYR